MTCLLAKFLHHRQKTSYSNPQTPTKTSPNSLALKSFQENQKRSSRTGFLTPPPNSVPPGFANLWSKRQENALPRQPPNDALLRFSPELTKNHQLACIFQQHNLLKKSRFPLGNCNLAQKLLPKRAPLTNTSIILKQ